MTSTGPQSSRDRVRAYRERLRTQGLRPIQIWVPDVNSPEFRDAAHRESLPIAQRSAEEDEQQFIESITDPDAL
jgi:hypothetical protein